MKNIFRGIKFKINLETYNLTEDGLNFQNITFIKSKIKCWEGIGVFTV